MVNSARGLPGVESTWIRTYDVHREGRVDTFSVLENSPENPRGTIVCVHGNPTWSFMWRRFVGELGDRWRVIAIDQLGMGFSSRPKGARNLEMRIKDLEAFLDAAEVRGPITLIAHDWGGPVSLGWATRNSSRVEKLVLFNTGTRIPTSGVPGLIQVANTSFLRSAVCSRTKAFLIGAVLPTKGIKREVRRGYYAPYQTASRRIAIADFVADIPVDDSHCTNDLLGDIAESARQLHVPTLLVWGIKDFVFHTGVLADMQNTFPHTHTITLDTGHLSPEHSDSAIVVSKWLESTDAVLGGGDGRGATDLNQAVRRRAHETPAAVAIFDANENVTTSWAELHQMISHVRAQIQIAGISPGDRVSILTPFTAHTIAFIYGCWAEGVVPVVADPGLGIGNMRRALRESQPAYVLTNRLTRVLSRCLHLAYRSQRLDIAEMTTAVGDGISDGREMSDSAEAAVLYTSGATGPAKGVVYTHGQLRSLAHAIQKQFSISDTDGIVAAYIPFALYGPAWGVAVALPKINVLAPRKLSAHDLQEALNGVHGTVLFAAPAPLRNVLNDGVQFKGVRCVMSAGAPVSDALLTKVAQHFPAADLFSPYGMTEMLIVTDGVREPVTIARGVPVGRPLEGVEVAIFPIGTTFLDDVAPVADGETGEIFVTGPWLSAGYDQHWMRNRDARLSRNGRQWHRTGDVGHINGGLFVEGRVAHVIHGEEKFLTPVPIEQSLETVMPGVTAAVVGISDGSHQSLVVVLSDGKTEGLADREVVDAVRLIAPEVVAVLFKKKLPVDRRHNSKIDRTLLGAWAQQKLKST